MLLILIATCISPPVDAVDVAFLKADPAKDMVATLLGELTGTFRPTFSEVRLAELEDALRPMYASLPKEHGHGKLDHAVSRYALHRLFVGAHGWFIRGLEPSISDLNGTSFASFFQSRAPSQLRDFLGDFEANGISLHGLSVLAATLEDLIHKEAMKHLEVAYDVANATIGGKVSQQKVGEIIDMYMTIYISGAKFENTTAAKVQSQRVFMSKHTQDWPETQKWIREVQQDVAKQHCAEGLANCELDFDRSVRIVEQIVEDYSGFNGQECRKLKMTLLEMEDGQTGRVRLADFYKKGLSGTWEFNEKIDYLRDLGVLDDSIEGPPRVIVANYVSSWVNCLTPSLLYAVCCRNECEDLMTEIERKIAAPAANPDQIIRIVTRLSTDTAAAPQNISPLLRARLENVAVRHHGQVPLHGRLFAQWMHHLFPHECPYPHEAGTTNPQAPVDWMEDTGSEAKASEEEMRTHMERSVDLDGANVRRNGLPWSDVEDVIVIRPPAPSPPRSTTMRWVWQDIGPFTEIFISVSLFLAVIFCAHRLPTLRSLVSSPRPKVKHWSD